MISAKPSEAAMKRGIRIKSRVKAGFIITVSKPSPTLNHNQATKGVRVKSHVRAGLCPIEPPPGTGKPGNY